MKLLVIMLSIVRQMTKLKEEALFFWNISSKSLPGATQLIEITFDQDPEWNNPQIATNWSVAAILRKVYIFRRI